MGRMDRTSPRDRGAMCLEAKARRLSIRVVDPGVAFLLATRTERDSFDTFHVRRGTVRISVTNLEPRLAMSFALISSADPNPARTTSSKRASAVSALFLAYFETHPSRSLSAASGIGWPPSKRRSILVRRIRSRLVGCSENGVIIVARIVGLGGTHSSLLRQWDKTSALAVLVLSYPPSNKRNRSAAAPWASATEVAHPYPQPESASMATARTLSSLLRPQSVSSQGRAGSRLASTAPSRPGRRTRRRYDESLAMLRSPSSSS